MSVTGKGQVSQRTSFVVLISIVAILLSAMALIRPGMVLGFTAGDNGHPTSGPYSDLNGGSATFTFQNNAQLFCDANDGASSFTFMLDYSVSGTLPAGSTVVVYLSPNQGAINGNGGSDPDAYVADVESNFVVLDVGNLSGSGTLTFDVPVTTGFTVSTGGILGVIATEAPVPPATTGAVVSSSKTNSLNCTEAESTPTPSPSPSPTPVVTPSPTPVVTPSPTPVVTPSPTPVVTPSPTPVVTPSPTPVVTPSPTPVVTPSPTPVVTPSPTPVVTPSPTPRESELGGTPTPSPSPSPSQSPRESELGGNPTPTPDVPNTAVELAGQGSSSAPIFALVAILALAVMTYARLALGRARR